MSSVSSIVIFTRPKESKAPCGPVPQDRPLYVIQDYRGLPESAACPFGCSGFPTTVL